MGTINRAANLYRQNNKGEYQVSDRAGLIGSMLSVKEQMRRGIFQYPLGEYHPRKSDTNYKANNQRPAEKRRNKYKHNGR